MFSILSSFYALEGIMAKLMVFILTVLAFVQPAWAGESLQYDAHGVRYQLYQSGSDGDINWLFLPGGPGADSSYLISLIEILDLPGKVWLIDLPGSGTNVQEDIDYDTWLEIFPEVIARFDHPVLVGHSFGGMFPLLFPELEKSLEGFVILHSAPCLWLDAAACYAQEHQLPNLDEALKEFLENPSEEMLAKSLEVCSHYYFPPHNLEQGREVLQGMQLQYAACSWWLQYAQDHHLNARWIPEKVPTLVLGGKYDGICPFTLFQKDSRFHRENIEMLYLEKAGHVSWMDDPEAVRQAFDRFIKRLISSESL